MKKIFGYYLIWRFPNNPSNREAYAKAVTTPWTWAPYKTLEDAAWRVAELNINQLM